jgi:hypothetical protein
MYRIEVTHRPSSTFGSDKPEALPEPRLLYSFRSPTGRRKWQIGGVAEVVLFDEYKHGRGPVTWVSKEAAERNLHHLIARGWTGKVIEV